jgi:hypothetical protein
LQSRASSCNRALPTIDEGDALLEHYMSLRKDRGGICDDDALGSKGGAWKSWLMFSEMRYREQAATSDVIEARVRSLQLKVMVGERWWLKLEWEG